MRYALCLSKSAFRNPQLGIRPKGGSPKDKSQIALRAEPLVETQKNKGVPLFDLTMHQHSDGEYPQNNRKGRTIAGPASKV